jgi:hypothetical protein
MPKKIPSEEYLKKAEKLTAREAEYLTMRMSGKKLARRLDDHKVTSIEALALQLEIEDEHRNEWRKNFAAIKARQSNHAGRAEE